MKRNIPLNPEREPATPPFPVFTPLERQEILDRQGRVLSDMRDRIALDRELDTLPQVEVVLVEAPSEYEVSQDNASGSFQIGQINNN